MSQAARESLRKMGGSHYKEINWPRWAHRGESRICPLQTHRFPFENQRKSPGARSAPAKIKENGDMAQKESPEKMEKESL